MLCDNHRKRIWSSSDYDHERTKKLSIRLFIED